MAVTPSSLMPQLPSRHQPAVSLLTAPPLRNLPFSWSSQLNSGGCTTFTSFMLGERQKETKERQGEAEGGEISSM